MSHTRLHHHRSLRERSQPRKLAFELLEDRQVLSVIYGPEPPKVWPSDVPGQCWSLPANAPTGSQPSLVRCGLDASQLDRQASAQSMGGADFSTASSFDSVATLSFSGRGVLSGNVIRADGSGDMNLGGFSTVLQGPKIVTDSLLFVSNITPVNQAIDPGPVQVTQIEKPAAVTLGNPAEVAKPSPPPESIFRPGREVGPMVWTVSPDAAQAIQRRYVVGSADVLSFGPSRAGQSLLSSTSADAGRAKKSNAGSGSATQLFEQNNIQAPLETNSGSGSVFELRKSTRSWSRLAAGILRASGDFDVDERIEIATTASPTSADASEIARDIIFANMASSEEKLPPPPNPTVGDQNRNSAAAE